MRILGGDGSVLYLDQGDDFIAWGISLSKFNETYTSNGCILFYINSTSIKMIYIKENDSIFLILIKIYF